MIAATTHANLWRRAGARLVRRADSLFIPSNMTPIPDAYTSFAQRLADEARSMLLAPESRMFGRDIKPDRSFVTTMDLAIERRLRALIEIQYPEHGVLGEEEEGTRLDAEWIWVLDPIDGTAPFIAGMPVYGTLIALAHRGVPCLGVIDFPATGDRWIGAKGKPTLHNGTPCATRRGITLAQAMQATMNPDFFDPEERLALDRLRARTVWRIYGGSAFSYGRLASGGIDVTLDTRLKVHDYAAFVPIIEGAGGVISDWEGQPLTLSSGSRVLAAGDAALHAQALRALRDCG